MVALWGILGIYAGFSTLRWSKKQQLGVGPIGMIDFQWISPTNHPQSARTYGQIGCPEVLHEICDEGSMNSWG
jgi:hypothetical protein